MDPTLMPPVAPTQPISPVAGELATTRPPEKPTADQAPKSVSSAVSKWLSKITAAKKKFEGDFQRMRDDMEFVGGIQWPGQEDLNVDSYIANVVLRETNQGVAALYARNPKATAKRRERLDFAIWDEDPQSLMQAVQPLMLGIPDPNAMALMADYDQGMQERKQIDRVARTLEIEYQIQIDRQEPNFKLQMKQLVRRVKVCGVGFTRACFRRDGRDLLTSGQTAVPIADRVKQIATLAEDYDAGKFDTDNAKTEQMKQLMNSVQYSMANESEARDEQEKLVFDFPSATSIIVDPACRIMKGFVGAKWVVQEYIIPIDDARAFFGKDDLQVGGNSQVKTYTPAGEVVPPTSLGDQEPEKETHVAVWELFDKTTQTRCFLCDGYQDYLLAPEEPRPCIQRFWPVIPLTFNDTETEPGLKVSIYPPSDVRLMRSPQKEINNCGQRLREHRKSNKPKYVTTGNWLTDQDKEVLKGNLPVGAVIELQANLPPGTDVSKVLAPFHHAAIDDALYNIAPLEKDILQTTGAQQANLGPPDKNVTATGSTIAEQSRISSVGSNVDDLDEHLSEMACVGGEMMLREMSPDTVKADVGRGAVWPTVDRDPYVDRIYLEIAAASTGRPNKGMEISNFQALAPLLQTAGANPQFLVREGVKRLDDRLDVQEAFPLMPPSGGPMPPPEGGPRQQGPKQLGPGPQAKPNNLPNGPSLPLAGNSSAAMSNAS